VQKARTQAGAFIRSNPAVLSLWGPTRGLFLRAIGLGAGKNPLAGAGWGMLLPRRRHALTWEIALPEGAQCRDRKAETAASRVWSHTCPRRNALPRKMPSPG